MKCSKCQAEIDKAEYNCPSCGKVTAKTRDDLRRVDPSLTRTISWTLIAMGVMGLVFVIANSWTSWYSGLDYVGPIALLLIGSATLVTAGRRK